MRSAICLLAVTVFVTAVPSTWAQRGPGGLGGGGGDGGGRGPKGKDGPEVFRKLISEIESLKGQLKQLETKLSRLERPSRGGDGASRWESGRAARATHRNGGMPGKMQGGSGRGYGRPGAWEPGRAPHARMHGGYGRGYAWQKGKGHSGTWEGAGSWRGMGDGQSRWHRGEGGFRPEMRGPHHEMGRGGAVHGGPPSSSLERRVDRIQQEVDELRREIRGNRR